MSQVTMRNATDEQLNEYFETKVQHLVKYIKKFWNWKSLAPKGYKKYLSTYEDYQDMETCKDHEAFTGLLDSSATGLPFPMACSIPHIAYDDTNQGRDPLTMLMMSCVSWGARLADEQNKRKNKSKAENAINTQLRLVDLNNKRLKAKYPSISDEDLHEYVKLIEFGHRFLEL